MIESFNVTAQLHLGKNDKGGEVTVTGGVMDVHDHRGYWFKTFRCTRGCTC